MTNHQVTALHPGSPDYAGHSASMIHRLSRQASSAGASRCEAFDRGGAEGVRAIPKGWTSLDARSKPRLASVAATEPLWTPNSLSDTMRLEVSLRAIGVDPEPNGGHPQVGVVHSWAP